MSALTEGEEVRVCGTCCHWAMPLYYLSTSSECLASEPRGCRTKIGQGCEKWADGDSHLPDGLQGVMIGVRRWA